eukprot:GILK01004989.1.p1 GENE.GILK01004989.1~~GILK01004989.1.p1  ORF type:complete len:264 (-),score=39.61 GILK01004989.1:187-978(-)
MGKVLTPDLVLVRSKSERLSTVKNLNLWGNDLSDISILREMQNVEVLSLSVNKIASLREFAQCPKLTELYLRKNEIVDLTEVRYLKPLASLRVLWLCDNPCAEHALYRYYVIQNLPQLTKLDNNDISFEERALANKEIIADSQILEGLHIPRRPSVTEPPAVSASPVPAAARQSPSFDSRERPASSEVARRSSRDSADMDRVVEDVMSSASRNSRPPPGNSVSSHRNDNILCAIFALIKELDDQGMEVLKREIDKRMGVKSSR